MFLSVAAVAVCFTWAMIALIYGLRGRRDVLSRLSWWSAGNDSMRMVKKERWELLLDANCEKDSRAGKDEMGEELEGQNQKG